MADQIEDVKTILKQLISRTKDFQSLNAFRLFVLQHNTYDVDKAVKLIKRGECHGAPCVLYRVFGRKRKDRNCSVR